MALTPEEQERVKATVAAIWNQSIADSLDYNDEVAEVVLKAVKAISECSESIKKLLIDATSEVAALYLTIPWLLELGRDIAAELVTSKVVGSHRACINTAAANWRSPLEMASLGI